MRETRAPVLDPGGGRPGPNACGRERAMTANAHTVVTSETKRGGAMAPLRLHMTLAGLGDRSSQGPSPFAVHVRTLDCGLVQDIRSP